MSCLEFFHAGHLSVLSHVFVYAIIYLYQQRFIDNDFTL